MRYVDDCSANASPFSPFFFLSFFSSRVHHLSVDEMKRF